VRTGRYFRIPEGPQDVQQLWQEAAPLSADALPPWLTPEDVDGYRSVGSARCPGLAADQQELAAELEELESVGLIIDADADLRRVFLAQPKAEPIWSIGIFGGRSPLELSDEGRVNPVLTAEQVSDVPATCVADPFLLRAGGRWFMFLEVMNWRTWKGEIGLATSPDGLAWTYQQIVLAEEFHLSYPYVFEAHGEYYMVPESFQDGTVRLYRARRFPAEWELAEVLLRGPYFVDSSVFCHDGRWWMYTETHPDEHDTLRLYHADALAGPWREHACSPLVEGDARIARPAGRVLTLGNRILRFAQNCQPSYGADVRALEVTRLTTSDYAERPARDVPVLGPSGRGWNRDGMHHVDAVPLAEGRWLAAVDGWELR
jgi:hypothetical protein